VWLHGSDRLLYRDTAGAHRWEISGVRTFAAGLIWRSPSVSLDDRIVAYSAAGTTGKPHIELRNLTSGSVRVLSGTLGQPILLSDTVMLESHMVANTQGPGPAYIPSGLFALNFSTNVETPVPGILMPLDSWPR
jgi:hypothetical protein